MKTSFTTILPVIGHQKSFYQTVFNKIDPCEHYKDEFMRNSPSPLKSSYKQQVAFGYRQLQKHDAETLIKHEKVHKRSPGRHLKNNFIRINKHSSIIKNPAFKNHVKEKKRQLYCSNPRKRKLPRRFNSLDATSNQMMLDNGSQIV